jgi:bis(5'-nucleosyl)-tetraphosphatase (symmetrical)
MVGDLVNGGGQSAGVLRWAMDHEAVVVAGNHDLHMLAVAEAVRPMRSSDDFVDVLEAPDADALLDWVRRLPLLHRGEGHVMVHAGLHPEWTLDQAQQASDAVVARLAEADRAVFFEAMYGNDPARPSDATDETSRLRANINALTRMRVLAADGAMDFGFSGELEDVPADRVPWFDHPEARWRSDAIVVFGHWSALGQRTGSDWVSLDSGCRWGRHLSALRLDDGRILRVRAS